MTSWFGDLRQSIDGLLCKLIQQDKKTKWSQKKGWDKNRVRGEERKEKEPNIRFLT